MVLLRSGKRLEALVLAFGIACGLAMVWASVQFGGRAQWVGRFELDRAAAELRGLVASEWQGFVRAGEIWECPGQRLMFDARDLEIVSAKALVEEDFPGREAFGVLLREARRLERARAPESQILDALESAAKADPPGTGTQVVMLRRLQLALGSEAAFVWWEKMLESARGGVFGFDEGKPAVVMGVLAMAGRLDSEQRLAVGAEVLGWIEAGDLRLGGEPFEDSVLVSGLAGVTGVDGSAAQAALVRRDGLRVLLAGLGLRDWDAVRGPVIWEGGAGVVVVRRVGDGYESLRIGRADLVDAFRLRLGQTAAFAGSGAFGVVGGLDAPLGLGAPVALGESGVALTLVHANPDRFISQEVRRQSTLRWALLGMGLATFLASAFAFGALRKQRRLAELKTEFIAKVSHELRTPVTGILLASEGLEAGRNPTAERRERYTGLIRREALRLERLVANVLDFSRLERGAGQRDWMVRETADLGDFVEWLAAGIGERLQGEDVEFDVDCGGVMGRGAIDREALRRAIGNLVENALAHGAPKRIWFSCLLAGAGELVLVVEDDGAGVAMGDRESVFAAFGQASARGEVAPHKGAGLGLAIVREIARGHGGDVYLVPGKSGRLVRFEVRLSIQCSGGDSSGLKSDLGR